MTSRGSWYRDFLDLETISWIFDLSDGACNLNSVQNSSLGQDTRAGPLVRIKESKKTVLHATYRLEECACVLPYLLLSYCCRWQETRKRRWRSNETLKKKKNFRSNPRLSCTILKRTAKLRFTVLRSWWFSFKGLRDAHRSSRTRTCVCNRF